MGLLMLLRMSWREGRGRGGVGLGGVGWVERGAVRGVGEGGRQGGD